MALSIGTNTAALMAASSATSVSKGMESSMERLATGKRINSASDDAAGVAIASRMESEIRGTNQAIRNAMDGQSLVDTAEGAQIEVENILQRMRELAVQASNDTNNDSDRANLQVEMDQLGTEINRIASTTTWGGKQLLNGTSGAALATSTSDTKSFNLQVGSSGAANNAITVSIGAMTTQALGLAGDEGGKAPEISNIKVATVGSNSTIGQLAIDGNTVSLNGSWTAADSFTVDINDVTVTVTLAAADAFGDDAAGFSAQLASVVAADATLSQYMTATDNGDGSVSFSQSATPLIDNLATTSGTMGNDNEGISTSGDTITFSGDVENGDVWSFNVNGVAVTVTSSDADGFEDSLAGLGAQAKNVIENLAGLTGNVSVIDNGDGSISLSQSVDPKIDAITKAVGTAADPAVVYSEANENYTFTNAIFEDGATYTTNINGTDISITASTDDGYDDSVTGIAAQFTQAINDAEITGVAATSALGVVTLVNTVEAANAAITSDNGTLETSIATSAGSVASATVTVTSTDDLMEVGDTVSFDVQGQNFSITVGDDGFENTMAGVAAQMKSVVDDAGLAGVDVAASSTTTGRVAQANVAVDVGQVASLGDVFTLTIADAAAVNVTLTYTTVAAHENMATVLAGLQADGDYATAAAAATGFTISLGDDGTSIDVNYNGVGAAGAISLQSSATDPATAAQFVATAGLFSVTGIANGGSNTAVITLTSGPDVSNTGVGGDGVAVSLENGILSLDGGVAAGDEISFSLGSTAISVTAYSNSVSDTAKMLVSAITEQSGGSIIASLNDDNTISVSNSSGSASVMSAEAALAAIENLDAALVTLNTQRATLGSVSNRLDSTVSNLTNVATNIEASRGRIEDADFAAESTAMSKAQILQQASTAMLAQANASKQGVLSLLQG